MTAKKSHEQRWRLASRNAALQIALEASAASHVGELPVPCQDLLDELLVVDLFRVDMTREIKRPCSTSTVSRPTGAPRPAGVPEVQRSATESRGGTPATSLSSLRRAASAKGFSASAISTNAPSPPITCSR